MILNNAYFNICSGLRAEEFVYQKLDKPKPPRLTESEALGQSMIEAGNDFGPGTNYGENYKLRGYSGKGYIIQTCDLLKH